MIAITVKAETPDGEILHNETVPCDLNRIEVVGKDIEAFGQQMRLSFIFDPPVTTSPSPVRAALQRVVDANRAYQAEPSEKTRWALAEAVVDAEDVLPPTSPEEVG